MSAGPDSAATYGAGTRAAVLGRRLGLTEGQVWTAGIGTVVAVLALVVTLPNIDTSAAAGRAAAGITPRAGAVAPLTPGTTDPPQTDGAQSGSPAVTPGPVVPGPSLSGGDPDPGTATTTVPASTTTTVLGAPPGFADGGPVGQGQVFAQLPAGGPPSALAVTDEGGVWLGTGAVDADPVLLRYSPQGTLLSTVTLTGREPERTAGVTGLAVRPDGTLLVAVDGPAEVLRLDPATGGFGSATALPDLRACGLLPSADACEPGLADDPPVPGAVAVASDGTAYVTDSTQAAVWRLPPAGGIELVVASQELDGIGGAGATGIAVDGAGNLVVSVGSAVGAATGGSVVLIDLGAGPADEQAPVTPLFTTDPGTGPAGLALGASGTVYLALSGADAVAVHQRDGTEAARYPTDGPVVAPRAVAFRGRSLLVTSAADPGAVIRIPTGEFGT